MTFAIWCVIVGGVLVVMALAGSVVRRLPLSAAIIYLGVSFAISPRLLPVDPVDDARFLEHVTEVAVLVSLFTAGLKLRVPFRDRRWWLPVRLAVVSMTITVGLVALFGVLVLDLPIGAAILLGAILAPTDPVLASDVQVREVGDRDKLRFTLTGEAGLNDGTAFPFVMLGLGLLGHHDLGTGGWRWWAVDVAWAVAVGLGVGFGLGTAVARLVLYLRKTHREAVGLDNFLALGLIALAYGLTILAHGYGFLAVFAAGLALRHEEMRRTGAHKPAEVVADGDDPSVHPEKAPAYMAEAVLGFTEQIERLLEVAAVVILGALLWTVGLNGQAVGLAAVLFLAIRPASVFLGVVGTRGTTVRRWLAGWFGVRGIGSLYYLAYATTHGLSDALARQLAELVLTTVALSVVLHGVSVTPLMDWYGRWAERRPRIRPDHESTAMAPSAESPRR